MKLRRCRQQATGTSRPALRPPRAPPPAPPISCFPYRLGWIPLDADASVEDLDDYAPEPEVHAYLRARWAEAGCWRHPALPNPERVAQPSGAAVACTSVLAGQQHPSQADVQATAVPLATCVCCPASLQGSWALVRIAACRSIGVQQPVGCCPAQVVRCCAAQLVKCRTALSCSRRLLGFDVETLYELHYSMITLGKVGRGLVSLARGCTVPWLHQACTMCSADSECA